MAKKVVEGRSRAGRVAAKAKAAAGPKARAKPSAATAKLAAAKAPGTKTNPKQAVKQAKANATAKRAKAKRSANGQAAAKAKPRKPFDLLLDHITRSKAEPLGKALKLDDPRVAAVLALAAGDPRVLALIETMVKANSSFYLTDFTLFPAVFLSGKNGERWNRGEAVVTPQDVCLAKTGAGDLYVWSSDSGEVRLLQHDRGWEGDAEFDDIDEFVEESMRKELEQIEAEHLATADKAEVARIKLAVAIAGDEAMDKVASAALEYV